MEEGGESLVLFNSLMLMASRFIPLSQLNDWLAVPFFVLSFCMEVLTYSTAGVAAVAAGAHMSRTTPSSKSLKIGLLAGTIRGFVSVALRTVLVLSQPNQANRQVKDRRLQIGKYLVSAPIWGSDTLMSMCIVCLEFAAFIGLYILAGMGFAAGIAALVAVLVFGLVPKAIILAALPAGFFLTFIQLTKTVIAIPFVSIPSHAIAAILFAQVAENQGLHICSLGIAAGAGAVFAAARIACLLPPIILSLLLIVKPAKDIFLQIMKDGSFPSTVPPHKHLASRLYGKIPKRMENIIFGPAYNVEPEDIELALQNEMDELSMHLDMEPVWFSRPLGLDQGKHYVLVVNNQKYELRNRQHVRYNTDPIDFEDCTEEELPVGQSHGHTWRLRNTRTNADTGLFDVLLIGWTNATHEEIDRLCKELIEGWKYRLVLRTKKGGNCQHFIQAIANSIIPTGCRALAWSWFQHGSYGPLQKAEYDKMREDILESGKRFIQLRSILAINPLPLVGAM